MESKGNEHSTWGKERRRSIIEISLREQDCSWKYRRNLMVNEGRELPKVGTSVTFVMFARSVPQCCEKLTRELTGVNS
jgi:hypothetical protein